MDWQLSAYFLSLPISELQLLINFVPRKFDTTDKFLCAPENQDCLLRAYPGRRCDTRELLPHDIRLRNFPLRVDQMERPGLDIIGYAKDMAESLVLLHWKSLVDGNDIEFVLGSAPVPASITPTIDETSRSNRDEVEQLFESKLRYPAVSLEMLDSNQCKSISEDDVDVKQLVDAFWSNDPYYPRPNAEEEQDRILWSVFRVNHLEASVQLTESDLPKYLLMVLLKVEGRRGNLLG